MLYGERKPENDESESAKKIFALNSTIMNYLKKINRAPMIDFSINNNNENTQQTSTFPFFSWLYTTMANVSQ